MKMQRTVYHIAGKDYEETQLAELSFYVQQISIKNFLAAAKANHLRVKSYGSFTNDFQPTWTNGIVKKFTLKGWPSNIIAFAKFLGKGECSELEDDWWIRNVNLRASVAQKFQNKRYNGYLVFDPVTKATSYKSNSPKKIEGKQAVINGKLWRKYLTA